MMSPTAFTAATSAATTRPLGRVIAGRADARLHRPVAVAELPDRRARTGTDVSFSDGAIGGC